MWEIPAELFITRQGNYSGFRYDPEELPETLFVAEFRPGQREYLVVQFHQNGVVRYYIPETEKDYQWLKKQYRPQLLLVQKGWLEAYDSRRWVWFWRKW